MTVFENTQSRGRLRLAPRALVGSAELVALRVVEISLPSFPRPACCSMPWSPLFLIPSPSRWISILSLTSWTPTVPRTYTASALMVIVAVKRSSLRHPANP